MTLPSRNSLLHVCILGLCLLLLVSRAFAQTSPGLAVQRVGGNLRLTVTGEVGSPCTIQYATNLSGTAPWLFLTNSTLAGSPLIVTNPVATNSDTRFYRVAIVAPTNAPWISAGTFLMGSPTNESARGSDETRHSVTISKGFYMSKYLVTQSNYIVLMATNPSWFATSHGFTQDLNRPVEQVRWSDATNYCGKLTQQERLSGRIFTNWVYRLPTEAEWEFACRAGTTNAFNYGINLLSGMANFNGQSEYYGNVGNSNNPSGTFLQRTSPVGNYQSNARGLYDMTGNVWEWCQDWYASFATNSVTDPQGPASGSARVFRGGAFNATGAACRSASRDKYNPAAGFNTVGFRVVLAPGP